MEVASDIHRRGAAAARIELVINGGHHNIGINYGRHPSRVLLISNRLWGAAAVVAITAIFFSSREAIRNFYDATLLALV